MCGQGKKIKVLLYRKTKGLSQICAKKKPQLGPIKWFLHYNNTPAHQTAQMSRHLETETTPFLPDLAPSNFWLFPKLRNEGLKMRTALFWVIMQRVLVIPYQVSGTTYQSHQFQDGTNRLSQNVSKELPILAA